MKQRGYLRYFIVGFWIALNVGAHAVYAVEKEPVVKTDSSDVNEAQQVNVESIKEKYWARGNQTELGVVQNRTYSKYGRFEVGLLGGVIFSDPFLSIQSLGFEAGYHISEFLSVNLLALKNFSSPSSALQTFQQTLGATVNTNNPINYFGGEVAASILYGKLSVLGQAIIYYDLHLLGGLGEMNTDSGHYVAPSLGIGQRFYLSQRFSLRVDYRMIYYRETINQEQVITQLGQATGSRDNWSNMITAGVYFLF